MCLLEVCISFLHNNYIMHLVAKNNTHLLSHISVGESPVMA